MRGIGEALDELAHGFIRIEANRLRVRSDERSPEDPGRPARHVITFEGLEERAADLRVLRDGFQRDAAAFAFLPQPRSKRGSGLHVMRVLVQIAGLYRTCVRAMFARSRTAE